MSDSTERLEGFDFGEPLDWIERHYHHVVVVALALFMFWNRIRTWRNFVVDGEVLFSGNDPWYHYRQTTYTVQNWPETMPFDAWTYFPYGNASGQFGTLFDQLMATVALVVGLGNPDQGTIAMVVLVMPVVLATLTVIPAYLIGQRLGGRFAGVVAVLVVALTSGEFLRRSLVGFADHHIAEALFQAVAILAIMVALSVATREKPIYEQLRERDFEELRQPLGWSILAGLAVTLYLWVWPFGVMLIGIVGIYFLIQLTIEFLRGESPEHTAFVGAVSMGTTGVLVLASINTLRFTPSEFSLLQPIFAFAVAVGCVFMAWLARELERRSLSQVAYPITILGMIGLGIALLFVLIPDVFDLIYRNLVRSFGFWIDPSQTGRTVGEVQPIPRLGVFFDRYGFAIIIAVAGALAILTRMGLGRRVESQHALVLVWAALIGMSALTQQRFEYYLAVPVAALAGYVVGGIFDWLNLGFDSDDVEVYQVLSVVAVVLVITVPMLVGPTTAVVVAERNGPGQDTQAWSESLDWMQDNTPEEGLYADDTTDLELYGTYQRTDDFEYEDGAYGVMSWWDYGHWITHQGERIPHANPHQQGSTTAANFLLADSEDAAEDVLQGIDENESAQNRYVMADWKMANTYTNPIVRNQRRGINGKFFAPTQFYDVSNVSTGDYWGRLYFEQSTANGPLLFSFNYRKQAYYDSMVIRLYRFHGSAVEPRPLVLDWEPGQSQVTGGELPMTWSSSRELAVRSFDNMTAARQYVENDSSSQIGGFGGNPSERIPALEHFRYVGSSNMDAIESPGYRLSESLTAVGLGLDSATANQYLGGQTTPWTKVFERVPGASIEGTGPANANITGFVQMRNELTNETFTYQQRVQSNGDGEFTMTVPYSTTGYDNWGTDDGRTNVSVRATGPYQFRAVTSQDDTRLLWNGTAHVPEGAVIGETDEPVTVELTETEDVPEGQQAIEDANGSADGANASGTDGGQSTSGDNGTSGDGTDLDNETASTMAEPTLAHSLVAP